MRLRNLVDDDSAVSPVIGVILMVAITVILAAVIASFVLGLGGQTQVSPTADFSFNYDPGDETVTVSHSGGDNVRADELFLRGDQLVFGGVASGDQSNWGDNASGMGGAGVADNQAETSASIEGVSAVSSGDSWTIDVSNDEYVLRVVWESSAGDTSSELAVDRGPGA